MDSSNSRRVSAAWLSARHAGHFAKRMAVRIGSWLTALLLSALPPAALAADVYPSQPVRLIVGYAPGGSTDVFARALAQKLSEKWKREVFVDNRPGGSEIVGAAAVASAKPDGYTLLLSTDQALLSNQFLFHKLPYDPVKGLLPIIRTMDAPMVMVVRANSPYQNVAQLLDAARRDPGKVSYSSNGPGGHIHQALNWLAVKAGVKFIHAPYKGGGPAMQAVLAGDVDMTAVPLSVAEPFLKSNTLRPLAATSARRLPVLADTPTLAELGYDVVVQALTAVVAPAGTPLDVVAKIATDVKAIVAEPVFAEREIVRYGCFAIGDDPREFSQYLARAASIYQARVVAADVKLD
ncbi:tripartite tricarboxylate transporter substrate binding protein [Xylophilus sp. GOD-11R]|uniref:Bug family tripartite tricarboxylate transporter substrate binding protein n=1 Tax=Xylophilus sp. GOD-11R TaxID=3089814 RepID=UPI00298C0133|nr:tripartite tricarboxylate transporter substrate binding protein [Xylophilus sp. GOD-11R]WPB55913.1 tripartite tricarboxylate transporter substrate binding protein [Xylophilus sp. GOD-11R]